MKLYLIRHAESIGNRNGLVCDANSSLTEEGIIQTRLLGQELASQGKFEAIYFSPLLRAKQTAEIIVSCLDNANLVETSLVAEKKDASCWEGKPKDEKPWDLIKEKRIDPDWKHEDEESFNEVKKRIVDFLTGLEKYKDEANIIVVTHNSFIKRLVSHTILGDKFIPELFYRLADKIEGRNGGITILEKKQKYYETKQSWYLATWMA